MRIRLSTKRPAKYHIRAERLHEVHTPFIEKSRSTLHTVRTSSTEPTEYDFDTAATRARNLGVACRTVFGSEEFKVLPVLRVDRLALKLGPVSLFRTIDHVPFDVHDLSTAGHVEPLPDMPPSAPVFEQTA